eukprot:gnl/Chilomastix_caulleri/1423.p1 GENE.gnl/Chilomastix_caulleri/1423~~gnl/Chilomastix_caulleri/1423.p1  ORF type:complete len:127 (+),score=12.99 gnl/Chilomastix_caulleri/1423:15-395(+)
MDSSESIPPSCVTLQKEDSKMAEQCSQMDGVINLESEKLKEAINEDEEKQSTIRVKNQGPKESELTAVMCIQNIPETLKPKDLRQILQVFGRVVEIGFTPQGTPQAYAFIQMQSIRACVLACRVFK